MDIICKFCGDAWDMDELHEERIARTSNFEHYEPWTYNDVRKDFYKYGCGAMFAVSDFGYTVVDGPKGLIPKVCPYAKKDADGNPIANEQIGMLQDLAGDDVDGLAADIEDLTFLGMLE